MNKNLSISSTKCFPHLCLTLLWNLQIDMQHKNSNKEVGFIIFYPEQEVRITSDVQKKSYVQ